MKLYGYKVDGETIFGDTEKAMNDGYEVVQVDVTDEQAEEILNGLSNESIN